MYCVTCCCLSSRCLLSAGYDLSSKEGFEELTQDFEKIIGWQFLRGLHINDSKGVRVCFSLFVSKYITELIPSPVYLSNLKIN